MSLGLALKLANAPLFKGVGPTRLAIIAATTATLDLATDTGAPITVDWGDGTIVTCLSGATVSRTYGSAYTGSVSLKTAAGSKITTVITGAAGWAFDLSMIPSATVVSIYGPNTVTGDLSSIPSATYVEIYGSNTVTGDLSSIPSATVVSIHGSNTVTGDLSSIPSATFIGLVGSNTVTISGVWTQATVRQVYVRGSSALSTPSIDDLLVALAATATSWISEKLIDLRGVRTSASDAAVSTLQGRGVTVVVSP